jgi:hypothetical protein
MGTEYERRLLARARRLVDLSEIKSNALSCLGGARHAGLDPDALHGLVGCAAALGTDAIETYTAGDDWTGRHPDDQHLLAHVASIEDDIEERLADRFRLDRQTAATLDAARLDLADAHDQLTAARRRLAAAHAMPVTRPCEGCHRRRAAAIEAAQEAVAAARAWVNECGTRIDICEEIREAMKTLTQRLRIALARIRAVPADLGETYESVYRLIRAGGHLPREGRWITGVPA